MDGDDDDFDFLAVSVLAAGVEAGVASTISSSESLSLLLSPLLLVS